MNTFAKSFLSLSLGLGLCAGAHAQSVPADAHKAPVKVEAPKTAPGTAKTEAVKTEGKKLEARAHDATKGKHSKAKPELGDKAAAPVQAPAVPEKLAGQPMPTKAAKELKPAAPAAVAPTAAKVLPKTEAPVAKPAK